MGAVFGVLSVFTKNIDETGSIPLASVDGIRVSLTSESVHVIRADSGDELELRLHGKSSREIRLSAGVQGHTAVVSVERGLGIFPMREELSLEIRIPVSFGGSLSLSVTSGAVEADPLRMRSIDIRSTSGRLEASGLEADEISISLSSGNLQVGKVVAKTLEIGGTSSRIVLDECSAGEAKIRSTSGAVVLRHAGGSFTVKTSSGKVTLEAAAFTDQSWDLESTSGSLDIVLPAAAEPSIAVKTVSGSIASDLPYTTVHSREEQVSPGAVYLKTTSGSIHIEKR